MNFSSCSAKKQNLALVRILTLIEATDNSRHQSVSNSSSDFCSLSVHWKHGSDAPNSILIDNSELCEFCWPMRWVLLTLKVSRELLGLQAITWSVLWVLTHIPKAELVLPPSSREWKQPVGRVISFLPTLSPHSTGKEMHENRRRTLKPIYY